MTSDPAALQQTYQPQVALTLDISVPISTIKGASTDKQTKKRPVNKNGISDTYYGVGDGQRGLACCNSWGRKESDMTEQLTWTWTMFNIKVFY